MYSEKPKLKFCFYSLHLDGHVNIFQKTYFNITFLNFVVDMSSKAEEEVIFIKEVIVIDDDEVVFIKEEIIIDDDDGDNFDDFDELLRFLCNDDVV